MTSAGDREVKHRRGHRCHSCRPGAGALATLMAVADARDDASL